jgi:ABC-type Co2+ transport system permease subunit
MRRIVVLAAIVGLMMQGSAFAHIPSIEPQATYTIPALAPASKDYSFASPRQLTSVTDSQAVFAYLTWGDVDFYKVTITAQQLQFGPVFVSASALPPGCFEYQNVYPVTALIGPQAPSPFGPPGE